MMKKLLLVTALFSTAALAASPNWVYVSATPTGTQFFLDTNNIVEEFDASYGDLTRAWVKMDHADDKTFQWRESILLYEIKCGQSSWRIRSMVAYNADQTVYATSVGKSFDPFTPNEPGTNGHTIIAAACE